MPDTAQEVRTILSRTLRELDEAIENPSVSSVLSALRSLLGVDDGDGTAAPAAQASRKSAFGASRRSQSARGGPGASGARKSAPQRRGADAALPRLTARSPGRRQKAQVAPARAAGETISLHLSAGSRASRSPKRQHGLG